MSTLVAEIPEPTAVDIIITDSTLRVDLNDGRTISVPLAWYPRLSHSTEEEKNNWELFGKGQIIHWEDIDEDISVEGLLLGKPSLESQLSFKKWLDKRQYRKSENPKSGDSY